jgi:hypothetical protein
MADLACRTNTPHLSAARFPRYGIFLRLQRTRNRSVAVWIGGKGGGGVMICRADADDSNIYFVGEELIPLVNDLTHG